MNIKSIEIQCKDIVLRTAFVTALRRVESVEFVRIFIECEDGSIGIGEAPATLAITGEDIKSIIYAITQIKESLLGLPIEQALCFVHKSSIGSSAKAALDIALISLVAQKQKKSLREYFNVKDFTPIKTDITISLGDEQKMLYDAKLAVEASMDILKVKLGSDISHAIRVTRTLSKELPNAKLLIDANQAWSKEETFVYIGALKGFQVELIEQPVVAKDIEGLKEITNASDILILADEAAFTLEDVKKIIETKSADMINIKLMKCGGVGNAIEILEYARAQGVKCMLGSMLEGPYSINAALYLAFAYRDVVEYVDLDSPLLYKELCSELDFLYRGATISLCGISSSIEPHIANETTEK